MLKTTQSEPLYYQLVLQIKNKVMSGELNAGDKLSSTRKFAEENNVSIQTAQNAFTELVNRGIVRRSPKNGTYISPSVKSKTIGILSGNNLLNHPDGKYYRLLITEVGKFLQKKGWNLKLYIPCDHMNPEMMIADLERDISEGYVRGLFYIFNSETSQPWLEEKCSVPWYCIGPMSKHLSVRESVLYKGLKYFADNNFRKIDVLSSVHDTNSEDCSLEQRLFKGIPKKLLKVVRKLHKTRQNSINQAYEYIREVYPEKEDLPEGILVLNDISCQGVIHALSSKGYSFPEDISLISHANKGMDFLSPVDITRFETDWMMWVQMAVDKFLNILDSENNKDIEIVPQQYKFIKGESCYAKTKN